jgi:hypothetical protein
VPPPSDRGLPGRTAVLGLDLDSHAPALVDVAGSGRRCPACCHQSTLRICRVDGSRLPQNARPHGQPGSDSVGALLKPHALSRVRRRRHTGIARIPSASGGRGRVVTQDPTPTRRALTTHMSAARQISAARDRRL